MGRRWYPARERGEPHVCTICQTLVIEPLGSCHFSLDVRNGLGRVQTLRTGLGTVENSMASVERKRILELLLTIFAIRITRIGHPSVSLHQNGWTQVFILVPPVAWTTSGAASTQDALVHSIKLLTIFWRLKVFALGRWIVVLQEGFDRFVLLVEVGHVGYEILDDVHVWKGVDFDGSTGFFVYAF